jgi:hypothetical protein
MVTCAAPSSTEESDTCHALEAVLNEIQGIRVVEVQKDKDVFFTVLAPDPDQRLQVFSWMQANHSGSSLLFAVLSDLITLRPQIIS